MRVGIPTEIKNNEYRVAITPAGVAELVRRGHEVLIQAGAGEGSAITDADFKRVGAQLINTADEVWAEAELLLKVKEPIEPEYSRLRKGQTLFTYLHLAASKPHRCPASGRVPRRSLTKPCRLADGARCRCWP
jgi:alanine dehydrogenase